MANTPFWSGSNSSFETLGEKYLKQQGITRSYDPEQCEFYVMQHYPVSLKKKIKLLIKYGVKKPILVWTHESYFCTLTNDVIPGSWYYPTVHIMNVYNRNLLLSNFSLYSWAIVGPPLEPATKENCPDFKKTRPIVSIMGFNTNSEEQCALYIEGKNIDLRIQRQNLSLTGHNMGAVDIYGRNWPDGVSKEESRKEISQVGGIIDWHGRKIEILGDYYFNICMENANFDYYCTEKIWDSIRGRCLPIYYGKGNKIYEAFPEKSFIDVADFNSHEEVIDYVLQMPIEEYCERMNKCIDVYNNFFVNEDSDSHFEKVITKTAECIRSII